MSDGDMFSRVLFVFLVISLSVAAPRFGACDVDHDTAVRVLEDEGYTDIQVGGHAWFACSEDDEFSSEWTAKRDGRTVHGVLCCGLANDCTVRH